MEQQIRRQYGGPRTQSRLGRDIVCAVGCTALFLGAVPGRAIGVVVAAPVLLVAVAVAVVGRLKRRASRDIFRSRPAHARAGRLQSFLRVMVVTAACLMAVAVVSFAESLTRRSDSSLAIRAVEWMRDNGAGAVVSAAERLYYTLTAPSTGGPALTRLPTVGLSTPTPSATSAQPRVTARRRTPRHRPRVAGYRPRRVRPVVHPRLPSEGAWRVTQPRFAGDPQPPILVTAYRPDPRYPQVVAGLAWINHRRTTVSLYPGLQQPPASAGTTPGEIPPGRRSSLLATFNGGFKHQDGLGGFFAQGRLLEPLLPGQGTILGTRRGHVDVRSWHAASSPGPGVTFARQNLPLIVDHRRPNPNLNDGPQWGATLGNQILVWRSGVGVDRHGDLIYAAAPYQTVSSLARILIHAGAVRAIELDINSYWVTLNTYGMPGGRDARPLLPNMTRFADRYLVPDDRDFFGVYLK